MLLPGLTSAEHQPLQPFAVTMEHERFQLALTGHRQKLPFVEYGTYVAGDGHAYQRSTSVATDYSVLKLILLYLRAYLRTVQSFSTFMIKSLDIDIRVLEGAAVEAVEGTTLRSNPTKLSNRAKEAAAIGEDSCGAF